MNRETKQALELQIEFNYLSPADIENILEWLADRGYLSEEGWDLGTEFWELFIKGLKSN